MLNLQISPLHIEAEYTPGVHRPQVCRSVTTVAEFLCTLFKYFEYHPENTDIVL